MRITGGRVRGRHLAPLKGLRIRPSSDLVRQAIFNLIGQDIHGIRVLDLFAGTGSLGIEALSRGAKEALFIDISNQAIRQINKNLQRCGFEAAGSVMKKDLSRGLPRNRAFLKRRFELVFMDPHMGKHSFRPYSKNFLKEKCFYPPR